MNIPVVQGGKGAFDSLLYPGSYVQGFHAAQDTIQNLMGRVSGVVKQSLEQSATLFDKYYNSSVYESAMLTRRELAKDLSLDETYHISSVEELQTANPYMRRWIMAEPTLKKRYHANRIDSFDSTYIAVDDSGVGVDDYDYRRVTDGVLDYSGDGKDCWTINFFSESTFDESEEELNIYQKSDILHTWKLVRLALDDDQDPTLLDTTM